MFTLKAVIEGSNGSQIRNPQYYASGFLTKSTGLMLPWPLLRVLKEHELDARPMHCGRMKNTRKIDTLRWQLKFGPVILLIGHAYSGKKDFDIMRGLALQHYISLRGYDDNKGHFFVYDSNIHRDHHKGTLPAGNIVLEYEKLLTYRNLGGRGVFNHFGIAVNYK